MLKTFIILVLLAGCDAECPQGQARANAGECVPGCMLIDGRGPAYGTPVFDEDGIFTGICEESNGKDR